MNSFKNSRINIVEYDDYYASPHYTSIEHIKKKLERRPSTIIREVVFVTNAYWVRLNLSFIYGRTAQYIIPANTENLYELYQMSKECRKTIGKYVSSTGLITNIIHSKKEWAIELMAYVLGGNECE